MPIIREWLRRLWGTVRRAPKDAVMAEELRLHLDLLAADLQRRGLTPEDARRRARLQAGGVAQAMDQRRDQRGVPWLEDLLQDVRFGARMVRRAPLITATALLTLTLAIGANSAIFSLVDPLLFRDLPVRDPARLVQFTLSRENRCARTARSAVAPGRHGRSGFARRSVRRAVTSCGWCCVVGLHSSPGEWLSVRR